MRFGQLFPEHFLREGITTTTAWRDLLATGRPDPLGGLRTALTAAFDGFPAAAEPDEAQTEQDLIFRILEAVGWGRDLWLVQPRAARRGRADVPDMLLFPDEAAKRRAGAEPSRERAFRHGVAVAENKRWDRPLDRAARSGRAALDEGEVPSTQMLRYLSRADTLSERRVQFGILTNGRVWRLYWQGARSRSEEFFEIDLPGLLPLRTIPPDLLAPPEAERDHWLRVFLLLFGRASFVAADAQGRSFHLLALDEGRTWESEVARDLSRLVFGQVFPALVRGLDARDPRRPLPRGAAYLRELKDGALVLLYRLLFLLHAEDRELLPVRDGRYDDYSLRKIREEIARRVDAGDAFSARFSIYQARVRDLCRAIDAGDASLGLPPYDGGLFDPAAAPILERVELPDAALAPLLDALSRRPAEGRRRWINWRDLSVQQLGSIYERLLEHELAEKDGAVAIRQGDSGRHGSGSYYTPEVLVRLILERAVGPLVEACRARFRAGAESLAADRRPKPERAAELAALDPASAMLDLKVCDPAMGSGHFLVSLVDYLADRVLEAMAEAPAQVPWADPPYASPLAGRIAAVRARILDLARERGWRLDEDQLDDRRLVRRMILKRVVHGVDKNPMAVELAKVALWLHTFTVGAPLSFLDHHLRCGDSLLGLWVGDVNRWLQERGSLIVNRHVAAAQNAAQPMAAIEAMTDADVAEAEASAATFAAVGEATEPLAAFLSLLQAERLLGVLDAAPARRPSEAKRNPRHQRDVAAWERANALNRVLDGTLGDPVAIARGALAVAPPAAPEQLGLLRPEPAAQPVLFEGTEMDAGLRAEAQRLVDAARALAAEHRFTHWQLAFPNVWRAWPSSAPAGGFDAVIGNPPYVRQEQLAALKPALRKAYATFDGVADLYVCFYELGLKLLRPGGRLSFVVSNKWLRAGYAEKLRAHFAQAAWLDAVIDFGHAKGFFPGTDVFPCVVVARRPDLGEPPATTEACQIPRDLVRLDRVSEQVKELSFPLPRAAFSRSAWVIERPEVGALLDKIRRAGVPLRDFAGVSPLYGIKTGLNEAFLIDTPTRDALVADDPGCAEIIKPYLRGQDIDRWHAPWAGLWMIVLKSSGDHRWPWSGAADGAERAFAAAFPSLHRHLKPLEPNLRAREDRGRFWWELRSCAYYQLFESPKIIYQVIQYHPRFSFEGRGHLANDKTFFLPTADPWLLACLNSPTMWWHNWRFLPHLKDEALSPMGYLVEQIPVARPRDDTREQAERVVAGLTAIHAEAADARAALVHWCRAEHGIERPSRELADPFGLNVDAFVAALRVARGRRRPLSPAGVAAARRAWAETVAPIAASLREAQRHERRLADLVNDAYGLTPEEVALTWATAPPRMPVPPPATQAAPEGDPSLAVA